MLHQERGLEGKQWGFWSLHPPLLWLPGILLPLAPLGALSLFVASFPFFAPCWSSQTLSQIRFLLCPSPHLSSSIIHPTVMCSAHLPAPALATSSSAHICDSLCQDISPICLLPSGAQSVFIFLSSPEASGSLWVWRFVRGSYIWVERGELTSGHT